MLIEVKIKVATEMMNDASGMAYSPIMMFIFDYYDNRNGMNNRRQDNRQLVGEDERKVPWDAIGVLLTYNSDQ
mgnify:CR=1 FL=1